MTTLTLIGSGSKSAASKNSKPQVKPHCKASIEDIDWIRSQSPCVQQLWLDCIAAEQFGGAEHTLETNLSNNAFKKAKKALEEKGLFSFIDVFERKDSTRAKLSGHRVKNLHGYYNKAYWESYNESLIEIVESPSITNKHEIIANFHEMMPKNAQILTEQELQNPNNVVNPISEEITTIPHEITLENHSVIPNFHEMIPKSAESVIGQEFQNPNNVVNSSSEEITTIAHEMTIENHQMTLENHSVIPNFHEMIPKSAQILTEQELQNPNNVLTNIEQPTKVVQYIEKAPNPALQGGGVGVEKCKEIIKPLTKEEIFNSLELATRGVCPPDEIMNQILETGYAVDMIQLIAVHPEWGVRIFQGKVIRCGEIEISDNTKWRSQRMRQLATFDALGECPDVEFLRCCWNDPPLQVKLRQMIKKYQWDLSPIAV